MSGSRCEERGVRFEGSVKCDKKMIRNFTSLEIWTRSRALVKEIYLLAEILPDTEKFGLNTQIKKAAVSVPSNIAEGCGRSHINELKQFLSIASGSLCEVETQLYLLID